MFDTCSLHIGPPKTGSSSIQAALYANRGRLAALGYFYPSVMMNHVFLASAFLSEPERIFFHKRQGRNTRAEVAAHTAAQMRQFETQMQTALRGGARHLVLSNENLAGLNEAECRRLAAYLRDHARNVQVICYVRHPLAQALSQMQERVKVGQFTLEAALKQPTIIGVDWVLTRYSAAFGKDAILLADFSRRRLVGGDVVEDFLHRIGLSEAQRAGFARASANESLSHEALLLADAAARVLPREVDGKWNPGPAQTLETHLMGIRGARLGEPEGLRARIDERAARILSFLEQEFAMRPEPPTLPPWGDEAPWGPQTLEDIVRKINTLSLENQRLRREIETVRAQADATRQRLRRFLRRLLGRP